MWLLRRKGIPAAVLLRAIQPLEGVETMRALRQVKARPRDDLELTSGLARLTQALAIDKTLNGADLVAGGEVWLEVGDPVGADGLECGPRIGIRYAAEKDRLAPWRFWVQGNPHISR
jgi:DNA-3-methyladenine glycosylase